MQPRLGQWIRHGLVIVAALVVMAAGQRAHAQAYAAMVIDARSGEVLHSDNADARLHPASLTKMMTLYIAFEAVRNGEISLDTMVKISRNAAAEPPSELGLRTGQSIKLRYLIRAAAVKSANDAATAIGEAIEGSEAAFIDRMNRTAKAMGMTRTTFRNAHGLTQEGHLSTARDMTILGRQLFYDFPEYYNLFSRESTDAGLRQVSNTNRRFLSDYKGADGIKTGYTKAAGFNLVASAERGGERIIATVFGGRSTAQRNAKVAELLDLGFRKAPTRVAERPPAKPDYEGPMRVGKTVRLVRAVATSPRPLPRPGEPTLSPEAIAALKQEVQDSVAETIAEAEAVAEAEAIAEALAAEAAEALAAAAAAAEAIALARQEAEAETTDLAETDSVEDTGETADKDAPVLAEGTPAAPATAPIPPRRPEELTLAALTEETEASRDATPHAVTAEAASGTVTEVVTRLSTSGGRLWGINIGTYSSRFRAEEVLLKTALAEIGTLDEALRKVVSTGRGFDANFVGMSEELAALACRRLEARRITCRTIGPS